VNKLVLLSEQSERKGPRAPEAELGKRNSGAASGNSSHHLLLSWGNSLHRRKTVYIGYLIYDYCLYCCESFPDGTIFHIRTDQMFK